MRSFIVALVFSCLLPFGSLAQGSGAATYQVYALRYATYANFPVSALVAGADKDRKTDIAMTIWLLKGSNGKNILVDTGCYHDALVKGNGLTDFLKPSDLLALVNLKPEQITDIVITHMHWDHADGMDLFPNAKIWIQRDEYSYYVGAAWQPGGKHGGIDREDVLTVVKLNMDGKVNLVDGDDREIIDGIRVYTGGRHTFASQYVGVRSNVGTMVIASDNMYLYENFDKHAAIAQTFDAESNLKAQDRMKQIASRPELIIPGHDPQVFVKYGKPGERVARIK
jgi:glyoxylase-like metal-dependent hydrolase (beta-lactamase superfamily II)